VRKWTTPEFNLVFYIIVAIFTVVYVYCSLQLAQLVRRTLCLHLSDTDNLTCCKTPHTETSNGLKCKTTNFLNRWIYLTALLSTLFDLFRVFLW